MESWAEYTRFSIGLFAMLTPFAGLTVFLSLTSHFESADKKKAATGASLTVVIVLLMSQFFGETILFALGTTLPSFQIAGGIIIGLSGLSMVTMNVAAQAHDHESKDSVSQSAISLGAVPIGIPLMAGPGGITNVIRETHVGHGIEHAGVISLIIVLVSAVIWVMFVLASQIYRFLGKTGITILTKIFGLVLVAIGVEIMIAGIRAHLQLLG